MPARRPSPTRGDAPEQAPCRGRIACIRAPRKARAPAPRVTPPHHVIRLHCAVPRRHTGRHGLPARPFRFPCAGPKRTLRTMPRAGPFRQKSEAGWQRRGVPLPESCPHVAGNCNTVRGRPCPLLLRHRQTHDKKSFYSWSIDAHHPPHCKPLSSCLLIPAENARLFETQLHPVATFFATKMQHLHLLKIFPLNIGMIRKQFRHMSQMTHALNSRTDEMKYFIT